MNTETGLFKSFQENREYLENIREVKSQPLPFHVTHIRRKNVPPILCSVGKALNLQRKKMAEKRRKKNIPFSKKSKFSSGCLRLNIERVIEDHFRRNLCSL